MSGEAVAVLSCLAPDEIILKYTFHKECKRTNADLDKKCQPVKKESFKTFQMTKIMTFFSLFCASFINK